jgi:hypothetical protein
VGSLAFKIDMRLPCSTHLNNEPLRPSLTTVAASFASLPALAIHSILIAPDCAFFRRFRICLQPRSRGLLKHRLNHHNTRDKHVRQQLPAIWRKSLRPSRGRLRRYQQPIWQHGLRVVEPVRRRRKQSERAPTRLSLTQRSSTMSSSFAQPN